MPRLVPAFDAGPFYPLTPYAVPAVYCMDPPARSPEGPNFDLRTTELPYWARDWEHAAELIEFNAPRFHTADHTNKWKPTYLFPKKQLRFEPSRTERKLGEGAARTAGRPRVYATIPGESREARAKRLRKEWHATRKAAAAPPERYVLTLAQAKALMNQVVQQRDGTGNDYEDAEVARALQWAQAQPRL